MTLQRDDEDMEEFQSRMARVHSRQLREKLWLPKDERAKVCARCTLVKKSMLTLELKQERFGLCARCLEVLWSEVGHDD